VHNPGKNSVTVRRRGNSLRPTPDTPPAPGGKICPKEFKSGLVSFLDFRLIRRFHSVLNLAIENPKSQF
jgi:hypothetical protein